jgi:hypothetical protein
MLVYNMPEEATGAMKIAPIGEFFERIDASQQRLRPKYCDAILRM